MAARIAVIANCQARPVADLIKLIAPDVEISGLTIIHLAKDAEEAEAARLYEGSDFIFAQAVQDPYPIAFLRTSRLKERYGDKVVTWPNLFYKGQCPDLGYVWLLSGDRVVGPPGEYQNLAIYEAWREGLGVSETLARLRGEGPWLDQLAQIPALSLNSLREREGGLDVTISDSIESAWQSERLFYTFNHPNKRLLLMVARALLSRVGITARPDSAASRYREPLDRILPALLPIIAERLKLRLETGTVAKGCEVTIGDTVQFQAKAVQYELADLVEITYRCLDRQIKPDTPVGIT